MAMVKKTVIWHHLIIDSKRLFPLKIEATDPEKKTSSEKMIKEVAINKSPSVKNWTANDMLWLNKKAGKKAMKNKETFGLITFIIKPLLNKRTKDVWLIDCFSILNSTLDMYVE